MWIITDMSIEAVDEGGINLSSFKKEDHFLISNVVKKLIFNRFL